MRRTLRSLGAVLLLAAAVSVSAAPANTESGRTYQYDSLARLVTVSDPGTYYQYDAVGRISTSAAQANEESGRTFQYDAENRLVSVSAAPANPASPGDIENDPVNMPDPLGL